MILDKLENADWYYESVPGLEQFMKFFQDNDLEEMPACKIYLDGSDLIVNIVDFKGKEESKCRMEAHKDYLDIQIPLGADEMMGWKAQVDCQQVTQEYDEGKDVEFYGDKATAKFTVPAGHFSGRCSPQRTDRRTLPQKTRSSNRKEPPRKIRLPRCQ